MPDSDSAAGRIASPREGFPAPDFTLETLTGEQVSLSDFRGKVVIVNLWASWCAPCCAKMPAMQRTYLANRDRGLEALAVNSTVQDTEGEARAFAQELGLTLRSSFLSSCFAFYTFQLCAQLRQLCFCQSRFLHRFGRGQQSFTCSNIQQAQILIFQLQTQVKFMTC